MRIQQVGHNNSFRTINNNIGLGLNIILSLFYDLEVIWNLAMKPKCANLIFLGSTFYVYKLCR